MICGASTSKGWFRTADGQRCDPLTITDADSRFLLECRIVPETIEAVQPVVEQAFRELGLPRAIRSDNGAPFASSSSPGGLSRLSVQWAKLGIRLERIEPGGAAAEWPSRAHACHAQGGDLAPAGRHGGRAAGAL